MNVILRFNLNKILLYRTSLAWPELSCAFFMACNWQPNDGPGIVGENQKGQSADHPPRYGQARCSPVR